MDFLGGSCTARCCFRCHLLCLKKQQQRTLFIWHFWFCALRGHSTAKRTKGDRLQQQREVVGWILWYRWVVRWLDGSAVVVQIPAAANGVQHKFCGSAQFWCHQWPAAKCAQPSWNSVSLGVWKNLGILRFKNARGVGPFWHLWEWVSENNIISISVCHN